MSKIRRKVTVENTKTISDSTSRRPSVFERLGPSTGSTAEVSCESVLLFLPTPASSFPGFRWWERVAHKYQILGCH